MRCKMREANHSQQSIQPRVSGRAGFNTGDSRGIEDRVRSRPVESKTIEATNQDGRKFVGRFLGKTTIVIRGFGIVGQTSIAGKE